MMQTRILSVVLMLALGGCNGGGDLTTGSSGSTTGGNGGDVTERGFPASTPALQYAFQDLTYQYRPLTNLDGAGWSVALSGAPAWLSASVSGGEVVLSGIPDGVANDHQITVTASRTGGQQSVQFALRVRGDLLRDYQWHLQNDGSHVFSRDPGLSGEDLAATVAWQHNVFGDNVKVAVSDTGLDITHPDLLANLLTGEHRNYDSGSAGNGWLGNPSPYGVAHGTAVSGIIAAVGWNNIGVTGIAPMARVAGFQFLDSSQTSAQYVHQASGDFDVFNYSYGTGLNADLPDDPLFIAQLRDRVSLGRGGKGQIFVKAAGNEYDEFCKAISGFSGTPCLPQNANIPAENNSPFLILAGASNAVGRRSSYANAGSNLWVAAPGGEYGDSRPAILSTDLPTCAAGYSSATSGPYAWNDFERYDASSSVFNSLNSSCNYTSTMNGTSSATPAISGVVALILAANPALGWRDVKHILAVTSDRIHPTQGVTDHPEAQFRLAGHSYELGWVQNAAGHWFNNWYGFGRVNAGAAVAMAKDPSYVMLPAWFESNPNFDLPGHGESGLTEAIPDANPTGVSRSKGLSYGGKIVESVQLKVKVTHARSGQVGVELLSPDGTRSILLNTNNALLHKVGNTSTPDADLDVVLTTHAFYGENADGNWTVKLVDGLSGTTGQLKEWSINVVGH